MLVEKKWRPEGFSNPYDYKIPIPSLLDLDHAERNGDATKFLTHEAFEAGADAMLEALRKRAFTRQFNSQRRDAIPNHPEDWYGSGVFVFIPDEVK